MSGPPSAGPTCVRALRPITCFVSADPTMMGRVTPRPVVRPEEAEALAAAWMRRSGFRDARLTGASADGGIDVWSSRALAQVKAHGKPVARTALQQLVGARGHDHGKVLLFFANENGYSAPAARYADEMGIALFTYDVWGRVRAVNGRARLVERAGRAESAAAGRASTSLQPRRTSVRAGDLIGNLVAVLSGISLALAAMLGMALLGVTVVRREAVPAGAVVLVLALAILSVPGLTWWVVSRRLRRARSAIGASAPRPPLAQAGLGGAASPGRAVPHPPRVGDLVHSPGDVTWFEYRASVLAVTEALTRIHALGNGQAPDFGAGDGRVTIAPSWAQEYPGFRSLTAEMERVTISGAEGVRVHWSVYADATPSTLDSVLDGIHSVTSRASDMLTGLIGQPVASGAGGRPG